MTDCQSDSVGAILPIGCQCLSKKTVRECNIYNGFTASSTLNTLITSSFNISW